MVLSFAATDIQLGLPRHAGVVMTALKLSAALSNCDRAMKAVCSTERSAAKYSWNWMEFPTFATELGGTGPFGASRHREVNARCRQDNNHYEQGCKEKSGRTGGNDFFRC
jgi:hypothetical protein